MTHMHKRQKIVLSEAQIRTLLGLPEDVEITSVEAHSDPLKVSVVLRHEEMPEIDSYSGAPIVNVERAALKQWTKGWSINVFGGNSPSQDTAREIAERLV